MVAKRKQIQDLLDRMEQIDKIRKTMDFDLNERFGAPMMQSFLKSIGWVSDETNYQLETITLMRPLCRSDVSQLLLDKLSEEISGIADSATGLPDEWKTKYEDDKTQHFKEFFGTMEKVVVSFFVLESTRRVLNSVCEELAKK